MTYLINYADGSSIVPTAVYLSLDEIAHHLASSGVISRKRIIEHAYNYPRLYTVASSVNNTLLTVKAIESLIHSVANEVATKDREKFTKTVEPIASLCERLRDYKRLTCDNIIGIISSSKI
ncbi:MAG: hypothetical protein SNH66_05860 [Rikenellaceae bacterium]